MRSEITMTEAEALSLCDIHYSDLPEDVSGVCAPKGERYVVVLNQGADEIKRRRALHHELAHIRLGHFSSDLSLREMEAEADELAQYEMDLDTGRGVVPMG